MYSHVGIVSLGRHAEYLKSNLSGEQKHSQWLVRSMPCVVREICHMFGLASCIYFECTMNTTNSAEENERNEQYGLCPVCICKLRTAIKFDCL